MFSYFGTLEDFTMNFTDPIELRGGAVRDAAMTKLKLLLRRILLRRERDDVLSDMLPPKRSYVVYCSLSATQRKRYVSCSIYCSSFFVSVCLSLIHLLLHVCIL